MMYNGYGKTGSVYKTYMKTFVKRQQNNIKMDVA